MRDKFTVTLGEVDNALAIMREVAQWCQDAGRKMWKPESLTRDALMPGLIEDNFCIGRVDGQAACAMILQWYDPLFWPHAKENDAGYIHKLCVRREYSGRGLSKLMAEFAAEECKKRGIDYLRLDTGWNNNKLCSLYESIGFVKVDKLMLGEIAFALFEMKVK